MCTRSRGVAVALLGTAALWLLYATGARLFGRAVGLLAAAIEAVAFLPVFYAHLALNDVPTLAPLTLSLLGTAGVLRKGARATTCWPASGLGLACASKYTAGIVVLPLIAAIAVQLPRASGDARGACLIGAGSPVRAALVAFLIANPYALLDYSQLPLRTGAPVDAVGRSRGQAGRAHQRRSRLLPVVAHLGAGLGCPRWLRSGGAVAVWRDEPRLGWVLVPAPLLFLAFMGLQGRYFGRWLLPIFPIVCLLAAYLVLQAADLASRRRPALRALFVAVGVVALCGQGLLYSIHSGLVLSRADTRNLTRDWMVAHVPVAARVVVEPVVPDGWVQDIGHPTPQTTNGTRWIKYASLRSVIAGDGSLDPADGHAVGIEDYERTLSPALIGYYEQHGFCWVVSGSTQSGRAQADPGQVPLAVAYYRALAQQGQVVYRASPYAAGRAGGVQLRLDLRLLPARLPSAGAGDDRLPAAHGGLRGGARAEPGLSWGTGWPSPRKTTAPTSSARLSSRTGA